MNSSHIALSGKGLTKVYPQKTQGKLGFSKVWSSLSGLHGSNEGYLALDNVSFSILKGESFGIIGKNGSGKSTLLQILSGTLQASSGSSNVSGRVAALLELGSGFNPDFTGRENIFVNGALHGLTYIQIEDRFDQIIKFAEIGDFLDQPVRTYSSGMQLRLAFAVIAHLDADILLIDEAFAVGDFFFMQKCIRFLTNFCTKGTLVLVTHDLASLQQICDRGLWLENGKVRFAGPVKTLCENYLSNYYTENNRNSNQKNNLQSTTITLLEPKGCKVVVCPGAWNDELFTKARVEILSIRMDSEEFWTGEEVELSIRLRFDDLIDSPLLGFHLRNIKGIIIIGEMVTWVYPKSFNGDSELLVKIRFRLPFLQGGLYSFSCAIANGTIESHVQHHLVHDAQLWEVDSTGGDFAVVRMPLNSSCSASNENFDER